MLFVVATPLGNLQDLSPRAREILLNVDRVYAEDTRVTRKLLTVIGRHGPVERIDDNCPPARIARAADRLDQGDAALVTDAGTPGISDPGRRLVGATLDAGHRVTPIPGPSAVATIVSVSPLVLAGFIFLGFPPVKGAGRRRFLERVSRLDLPAVLFEAPRRIHRTLSDLIAYGGDRQVTVGRELTKLHEEIVHDRLSKVSSRFTPPRGEFTLVVAPAADDETISGDDEIRDALAQDIDRGLSLSAAAREVARLTGRPKSEVYRLGQSMRQDGKSP